MTGQKAFIIIGDKQVLLLRDFAADPSYSRVPESEVLKRKLIKNTLVKTNGFLCTGPWAVRNHMLCDSKTTF